MKIIIAGCGRLGSELAQLLDSAGHKTAIIDRDANAFKRLKTSFGGKLIEGVAFDRDTLISAGIENADALASVTNGDNVNIITALIAKRRFKVPIISARVYDPVRAEIYRKIGINTVSPTIWAAQKINDFISNPDILRANTFGNGEVEILEIVASVFLDGRYVKDVTITSELNVISIARNGIATIPTMNTSFKKGDIIYLAATPFGKAKMHEIITT